MIKLNNIPLILLLVVNFCMIIAIFQQNSKLKEYENTISGLEAKVEDVNKAIEEKIVPMLEELQNNGSWGVRETFIKNGKKILGVMPDPELKSGKPYGYIFSFYEPFETYEGKELAVFAYHKETGEKIVVVPPTIITEPSSGYTSLDRFTAFVEIPYSGLWRYEIEINSEFYAEVVLSVK